MKGWGGGWEYSNDWEMMSETEAEFDSLIWKLQGDTVRNLYLTQKSMDGLFLG